VATQAQEDSPSARQASKVTVTVLSSNLADGGTIGEWGFSALVQADNQCVLFDAGRNPDTVLRNIEALEVDLSCVTDVALSHFHFDHTTGLIPLVDAVRALNPDSFQRVHVGRGFFLSRRLPSSDEEWNLMIAARAELEARGVEIVVHDGPAEILPSVWVTGPVKRTHDEKTYPKTVRAKVDGEWVEDWVPDSQSLTVVTPEGPIVLLGCGHSGSVNLLEQVRSSIQDAPIHALMGGMHLATADDDTLDWTGENLRRLGLENLMAGHCTGIEPLMHLRRQLGLDRTTAVVGAVGSRFILGEGIHPTVIAQ